jgi:tetratricopeptide (TPR) repeat protein
MMKTGIALLFIILLTAVSYSQGTRELINGGVDKYKNKKYVDSEIDFRKGLEKAPDNFAANFNLGDAYYKQQRYEDALGSYKSALNLASSGDEKAKVYHNIGNSLLKSQKYKESVDAYKKALKLNPDDADTKYNLSYALNMLNQKQNQQNQQNKDQNKDNKDNKDNQDQQQQNQDNQDKNKNKQNQDKDQQNRQNPQNQESKQDNLKQKEQKMSKEEAERILQALKNNEQDLQKKLRKQKGIPVKTDKDW